MFREQDRQRTLSDALMTRNPVGTALLDARLPEAEADADSSPETDDVEPA
jgi:hypothetical protein